MLFFAMLLPGFAASGGLARVDLGVPTTRRNVGKYFSPDRAFSGEGDKSSL